LYKPEKIMNRNYLYLSPPPPLQKTVPKVKTANNFKVLSENEENCKQQKHTKRKSKSPEDVASQSP